MSNEATVKLYDQEPYETTFTAKVLSCRPAGEHESARAGHSFAIELDRTLFFPEGGGQTSDTGVLTQANSGSGELSADVIDVQETDGRIFHFAGTPLEPGSEVTGKINWAHRFDNMQQHTGEHIVSGLAHKLFGLRNVGFHLSDQTVTMDYDRELSAEQIETLETEANRAIWDNRAVTVLFPTPEELTGLDYRSKIDLTEGVRLVRIDGVDLCACCAPHVRTTAEVGLLKIVDYRRYKGGMRLWIVCGSRALADYRMLHDQSASISEALSAPRDELLEPVLKIGHSLDEAKSALIDAQSELLRAEITGIPSDQVHVLIIKPDITNDKMIRGLLNELAEAHSGYCFALFNVTDNDLAVPETTEAGKASAPKTHAPTWRYICASTGSDCRAFNEQLKSSFPVRGGGQPTMVQGSVTGSKESLSGWFKAAF